MTARYPSRKCLTCCGPVTGDPRRIYCGAECKAEMRRLSNLDSATRRNALRSAARIKTKRCKWCDKSFSTVNPEQYCCSNACGRRWRSARYIERRSIERAKTLPFARTCPECGKEYPNRVRGKGSVAKRCPPCRLASIRRSNKASRERARARLLSAGAQVERGDTLADRRAAAYAAVVAAAEDARREAEAMREVDPASVYAYACAACGVESLAQHRHGGIPRRYCLMCRPVGMKRAPKAPRAERTCGYCGRLFAPWRDTQHCCCETCGHRLQWARQQVRIVAKREAAKAAAKAGTK